MKGMEGLCYVEVDIGSLEPVHWYEHFFFETFKKTDLSLSILYGFILSYLAYVLPKHQ